MSKEYVLVRQGVEIYRTPDMQEAREKMAAYNFDYHQSFLQWAAYGGMKPLADNEVFMYEHEKTDPICCNCFWCGLNAFHSGRWYCKNPEVSVFDPSSDLNQCFRLASRFIKKC